MTETVDDALVAAYREDGAVVVRGAFTADEVALAAAGIEHALAAPGPLFKRASADTDGAFVEDFCTWSRVTEIEQLALRSAAPAIAARLTGSREIRLYHDHVLVKEPGTAQRTPWHQDLPYYDVEGTQNVSVWFPVDPVPRAWSLQVVAGSHRGTWYLPRTFLDGQASWFPPGTLAELPLIDDEPDRYQVLAWDLEPGDAVFFHMLALHAAPGVPGPQRRRVVSLRYLGDDMVHAPRPWRTSPPFDHLAGQLTAGAPLAHPAFPLAWPHAS
jgi:ectoine hydroxylase-related dioxygenase (phytanoyl-CoA dioxygenase family)